MSIRRRIESIFGWMKTIGGMEKTRSRGLARVGLLFSIAATAYTFCASPDWLWPAMPKNHENTHRMFLKERFSGLPGMPQLCCMAFFRSQHRDHIELVPMETTEILWYR